jgi:hypothetical protein
VGIPISLILIAVGAILAFAVHQDPNPSVDIDVVGWVLMLVGLFGLLLSLFLWERFGPGYWGGTVGPIRQAARIRRDDPATAGGGPLSKKTSRGLPVRRRPNARAG